MISSSRVYFPGLVLFQTMFLLVSFAVFAAPVSKPASPLIHRVLLSDLGYSDGIVTGELESVNHLFFPIPKDTKIESSWLFLDYSRSPLLHYPSNMRILVNGTPRSVVTLVPEKNATTLEARQLTVPLNSEDLRGEFVDVTLRSSAIITNDVCLDDRMRAGFVHIKPTTAINYKIASSGNSISAFLQLLPRHVTLSLGSTATTAEEVYAALRVIRLLESSGHSVEIVRLPKRGEIIIAPLAPHQDANTNLQLVGTAQNQALQISEPFGEGSDILSRQWSPLLVGPSYLSHVASTANSNKSDPAEVYVIPLSSLDLQDTLRETHNVAEWRFALSPQQLPPSFRPTELEIDVISTPGFFDKPVLFYAFVNGILLNVEKLSDDGRSHRLNIEIPENYTQIKTDIKLMALRADPVGKCGADTATLSYPIQVLPSSRIFAKRLDRKPETFSELSTLMQAEVQVFISKRALENPENTLSTLARITNILQLESSHFKIEVADSSHEIRPSSPFILIGEKEGSGFKAPVRFDRGKIEVRAQDDALLLEVAALSNLNVVQLASKNGYPGVWLSSETAELPRERTFKLISGDVAFLGKGRLVLTLDSRFPYVARIYYPSAFRLGDLIHRYRWLIFLLIWAGLTVAFFRYYRKHQAAGSRSPLP